MVRENNWISSDPLLNRLQIPKPSAFLKMSIILFGIAAVSLFRDCGNSIAHSRREMCLPAEQSRHLHASYERFRIKFFPKEILKLFSILVTTVVFLALTERISTKISLFALVFKSLAVVALSSFLFALYTVVNDTSIPYGATNTSRH
ncbi:hypothetical protein [Rhizobium leguminosarum]|nr:hypothetical protein [Rhizobium leguminosarum]